MKNNKVLLCILLLVLLVTGWNRVLGNMMRDRAEYQEAQGMAVEKMEKGLYQEAISCYEQALTYKSSPEMYEKLLQVYKEYYDTESSETVKRNYISALDKAAGIYPQKSEWWLKEVELYLEGQEYEEAKDCLKRAEIKGADMDDLKDVSSSVMYAFDMGYQLFPQYTEAVNGYYTVSSGTVWSCMDLQGEITDDGEYQYISRIGEDGIALQVGQEETEFVDRDLVVKGFCKDKITEAGIYAEGKIAVKDENEQYAYLDLDGNLSEGKFEEAGAFKDGMAAVKKNGKWGLINIDGKYIVEPQYQDIKLNFGLGYQCKGIVIARKEDKYHFYDKDWKEISDFQCEDIDVCTEDGIIAYEQNGKWGFVKTDGSIVFEPAYERAKSFSNGLAAVCKGGRWGFINDKGEVVIEFQFLDAGYFNEEGNCMVSVEEGYYQLLKLLFL